LSDLQVHTNSKTSNMALLVILLAIAYCLATSFSIVLLGDKKLISNDNWKFIASMALAVVSRFTFILINSTLLKMDYVANAATTISAFITLLSIVFIVVVNYYFLDEALNLRQGIGAFIVLFGIFIMLTK